MNLRPPGYEPGELPDCSTPRRTLSITATCPAASSMRVVTTAVWAALGFFFLVLAMGMIWAAYQFVLAWKQFRRLPAGTLEQVSDLARDAAEAQQRVANLEQQVAELERRLASLNISLARARVLAGAAGEVSSAITAARSFIPSK